MDQANTEEEESEEPTAPFWMTTYGDMVTLLLTFFVLIVSMSTVELERFKEALSYFQGRTSILLDSNVIPTPQQVTTRTATREQTERFTLFQEYLKQQGLEDKVRVNMTEKGLHIVITDSVIFRSGEAVLIEPARMVLRLVSSLIDDAVQSVVVEGHTDNRPIQTVQFPSNWELSAARASSVVRYLLEQNAILAPEHYMAIGYGEYRPVTSNETPAGRSQNRRVEILFNWKSWQSEIPPYLPRTTALQQH